MASRSEAAWLALVVGKRVTERSAGPLRRASPPRPASFKPLAIGLVVFPHTQLSVKGLPRLFQSGAQVWHGEPPKECPRELKNDPICAARYSCRAMAGDSILGATSPWTSSQ